MPLQQQLVPISFGEFGLNTKPDPKQLIRGLGAVNSNSPLSAQLRVAKNVVYETLYELRKRNGYDNVALFDVQGTTITDLKALSKFKKELVLLSDTELYALSNTYDRLQEKGSLYNVQPQSTPIVQDGNDYDSNDILYLEGLYVSSFHNNITDKIYYTIIDSTTNTVLASNILVDSGQFARISYIGNTVFIVYASGTNLYMKYVNVTSPTVLSSRITISALLDNAAPTVDTWASGNRFFVAYNSTNANKVQIVPVFIGGVLGSSTSISSSDASNAIDLYVDSQQRVCVLYANTTKISLSIFNYTLTTALLGNTTIDTVADINSCNIIRRLSGDYKILYEIKDALEPINSFVDVVYCTLAGVRTTPAVFVSGVGLYAKQFYMDDQIYGVFVLDTELQSSYFVMDDSAHIVSKMANGVAGGILNTGVTGHSYVISDTQILTSTQIKTRNATDSGTFFSLLGIMATLLNFAPSTRNVSAQLGDNLHIGGGFLQMYDGTAVVEHGFHYYPEIITAGATTTIGGFMSDGNYGYKALYSWIDAYGQQHRSAPTPNVLNVTLSGGTSTQTQAVQVPTLRLTAKLNVTIELYRTENNGTTYYKVNPVATPTFNNKAVNFVTIVDTLSDSDLISRETLYTTGGELDNIAAPAAQIVATHTASSRIILLGLENENTLQFSKIQNTGQPVTFSDQYTVPIDPVGGKLTMGISMDEKFVIFEEDALFYVSGTGPNNNGEQNDFTEPQLLSNDVGCTNPQSVVLTPVGIMFKSRKGIYLLGRDLSLTYIGQQVEKFNSQTISSAKIVGELNQVRFTCSDGEALVYNYHLARWATFDNHTALSSEVLGNEYYYIRQDGTLFKENRESFLDNGSPINIDVVLGWLSFGGLQGFGRVYSVYVLGEFFSPHMLNASFAYDFNEVFTEEITINPLDFVSNVRYGDSSPYGSESPEGGSGNVYQMRIDLTKQKCESFQLRLHDIGSNTGEGLSLSAVTLLVGVIPGPNRITAGKKYGSS